MNLDLFNRVNLKENSQNKGMYSEWTSLTPLIKNFGDVEQSVLGKFGSTESKEVTLNIVRQLSSNLGISQAAEPSPLNTDYEVLWCMEVICYGLSLPLTEQEAIKDCVSIYCDWLTALLQIPKVSVPKPVCDDPNVYARKIIGHFHFLFVPRQGEGIDIINKQAVLCHRVLRTLKTVAHESTILERSTWEALLLFLLAINDTLLAPPTVKDDVADQLCERVLSVLFEIWLLACAHSFPSPPLWKTLRESCLNWRHRVALVEQWNRVNLALTAKLLTFMYGPDFPELKLGEEDLIPKSMSNDCIAQSWYRMLNTIGHPICFTRPEVISQTQSFLQSAISPSGLVDPCQHPSLQSLPIIFLKAMKGIAGQVDAFLGIAQPANWEAMVIGTASDKHHRDSLGGGAGSGISAGASSGVTDMSGGTGSVGGSSGGSSSTTCAGSNVVTGGGPGFVTPTPTPPTQRRLAKSFSGTSAPTKGIPKTSLMGLTSSRIPSNASTTNQSMSSNHSSASSLPSLSSIGMESKLPLAPGRPKCNSVLHLYGDWLFQAACIGSDIINRTDNSKRPNSILIDSNKSSLNYSQPSSLSDGSELGHNQRTDKYREGRAEALGTLCRIMCSKKTGEEILPVYLARFYLAVSQGMKISPNKEYIDTVVGILMNSADLFRLDLDGARMLLPAFISALELVVPDRESTLRVNNVELRRASIHLLLSMLVLPLHFQNAVIKELISTGSTDRPITFAQLKPRLINLVMNGLQGETDPQNTHMLVGGLFLCVQDSAIYEKVEQVTQPSTETSSNLLSSVSETSSTISGSTYSDRLSSLDMSDLQPIDSAHALFVRATYLVCHRLISTWKTDLNVSLAALELLSGLARIHIRDSDALECKRAVKWLCDYIIHQCSRPPQSHSKDLHSTIVAAFHCCSIWVLEHPYLLKDKESLTTVLEVAELGVSGTKSVGKPGEKIKMKDEKELKPVSLRVRDAAENLLTLILEQVGYFPSECGPESLSSLLDEMSLLQHCNSWMGCDSMDQTKAVERFRYFVSENSVMLALLEEPLGNDQDPQPTVTILIRDPFGRHAWTMQLRHLPRHKSSTKYHAPNLGRPVVMQDEAIRYEVKQKYFPDSIERVPTCGVDQSIPSLESIYADDNQANDETNKIAKLLDRQTAAECNLVEQKSLDYSECSPPQVCNDFQTARLFLSHFGLLNLDGTESENSIPSLIALDSSDHDFCQDLFTLDSMSPRTCDTVHIFYVRSQQTIGTSIVNNTSDEAALSPYFMQFIRSLGWPVNVGTHPGWTGHISTSWKINNSNLNNNVKHCLFDGQSEVLYWADACSEIAFVLPSDLKPMREEDASKSFNTGSLSSWCDHSLSLPEQQRKDKHALSLDLDKQDRPISNSQYRSKGRCNSHLQRHCNTKVMVVWLETYEDHLQLPIEDLLPSMETGLETSGSIPTRASDVLVIGLHLMASGLLRVRLQLGTGQAGTTHSTRVGIASPLIDGMVVSRRTLGPLVRQTALNMSRRRTLDSDTHQPPHVRRRLKIQEIVKKYRREMTTPELLTYLFSSPL